MFLTYVKILQSYLNILVYIVCHRIIGNVVSYLNVSIADVLHGGYYTCLARNILGLKSHSAAVKIYGTNIILFIRRV